LGDLVVVPFVVFYTSMEWWASEVHMSDKDTWRINSHVSWLRMQTCWISSWKLLLLHLYRIEVSVCQHASPRFVGQDSSKGGAVLHLCLALSQTKHQPICLWEKWTHPNNIAFTFELLNSNNM
jgi:hypothetical protein